MCESFRSQHCRAVYFTSDESRFHTGDVVIIEGGWMANAGKSDVTELPPWP